MPKPFLGRKYDSCDDTATVRRCGDCRRLVVSQNGWLDCLINLENRHVAPVSSLHRGMDGFRGNVIGLVLSCDYSFDSVSLAYTDRIV